jgi:hypothetical protein
VYESRQILPANGYALEEDGAIQGFEWDVELENPIGGYYSLRVVQGTQTADSNPIWIIDESGQGPTGPPPSNSAPAVTADSTGTSASPTNAAESMSQQSASIAATASTLVTTVISGTTITVQPETTAPTGNSTSNPTDSNGGGGLSGGAIAGIVIGVLVLLVLICAVVWFMRRRMQQSRLSHNDPSTFEKKSEAEYTTPAAFAGGTVAAGAAGTLREPPSVSKPELHAEPKPLRASPGLHEMPSQDDKHPISGASESQSQDGSHSTLAGRAPHSRNISSPSDASGSTDRHAGSSELVGSLVGGSHGVSPQDTHVIPRKNVSANDNIMDDSGSNGIPPTIHEMG